MSRTEEIKTTQAISRIKQILEEVACNPDEYDLLKTAVEIYELDKEHSPEPSWHHSKNILGGNHE